MAGSTNSHIDHNAFFLSSTSRRFQNNFSDNNWCFRQEKEGVLLKSNILKDFVPTKIWVILTLSNVSFQPNLRISETIKEKPRKNLLTCASKSIKKSAG